MEPEIHTVQVPSFNSARHDFARMAAIEKAISRATYGEIVEFRFNDCRFIDPAGVVLLALFQRRLRERGVQSRFYNSTMTPAIEANLVQNGFARAVGATELGRTGNSIPFREDLAQDEDSVIEYLREDWLGRGWVAIPQAMANDIAGKLLEVYVNAFEHGSSTVGVMSCGQYFPKKRVLTLAVGDYGVGIPSKASQYYKRDKIPGNEALKWAFTRGMTTLINQGARGLGFDFLREFVQVNNGHLEVYSHNGYAEVKNSGVTFESLSTYVKATMIRVTLSCDQSVYRMPDQGVKTFQW